MKIGQGSSTYECRNQSLLVQIAVVSNEGEISNQITWDYLV